VWHHVRYKLDFKKYLPVPAILKFSNVNFLYFKFKRTFNLWPNATA